MYRKHSDLSSLHEQLQQQGGSILLIQTAFLGDVILLTPLIGALRKLYPNCRLSVITRTIWAGVISNIVDEIVTFDKDGESSKGETGQRLISTIKAKSFDLAIIPHRSYRSANMARKAGIKHRIGFRRGGGRQLHTIAVEYPIFAYEGDRNLRLLEPLTKIDFKVAPFLKPTPEDEAKVQTLLTDLGLEEEKYVVVAPGSVWKTKCWLGSNYRSLIGMIKDRHEIDTVLIGSQDDRKLCTTLALQPQYNLAGQLTLLQSAALIGRCKFVISGDSAPAHMATAMNCRQLIILGSTSPRFGFVPQGKNIRCTGLDIWCRPCTNHGRNKCPLAFHKLQCLTQLAPADIYNNVKDWL